MASEFQRPKVLANFKRSRGDRERERRAKPSAAERRDGMSARHLAAIRKCPCVACLPLIKIAGECHHLKMTGERGMALRSTDRWGVPLCHAHHDEIERAGSRNERAVFAKFGIEDAMQLAADLWRASPDVGAMTAVIFGHRGIRR